jgi:hypothetical protein
MDADREGFLPLVRFMITALWLPRARGLRGHSWVNVMDVRSSVCVKLQQRNLKLLPANPKMPFPPPPQKRQPLPPPIQRLHHLSHPTPLLSQRADPNVQRPSRTHFARNHRLEIRHVCELLLEHGLRVEETGGTGGESGYGGRRGGIGVGVEGEGESGLGEGREVGGPFREWSFERVDGLVV